MNSLPAQNGPIPERSPIVRFFRWLFSPRTLGRLLFAVLTLATLVAAFYGEERWRGKRAWERYKAEMTAKGRHLDFEAYIPKKVPDEQNFAMTPFLVPLFDFLPGTQTRRDTNAFQRLEERNNSTTELAKRKGFDLGRVGRWDNGEKTDLITLLGGTNLEAQHASPATRPTNQEQAAVIILDLFKQTYDPVLDELRTASRRPYCRFNIKYDHAPVFAVLLPHLAVVKGVVTKLSWRADAELVLGKTNEAFEDLTLGLYVSDSVRDEPFLISELVRLAARAILTRVIWDGMTAHQWSDAQLQRIQAVMAKDDFMEDTLYRIECECSAYAVRTIEQLIANRGEFYLDDLMESKCKFKPLHRLMPTGWLYFEMVNLCQGYELYEVPYADWKSGRTDMRGFIEALDRNQSQFCNASHVKMLLQHRLLCGLVLPSMSRVHHRSLLAQARSDLTRTACALERYYLANGSYPDTLAALTPNFLPKTLLDVMTGKPLIYRRDNPQAYVLYSVGQNLVDDGGTVVTNQSGGVNFEQGDWVWLQPGKGR
jgi:Tfp pilus assembly protein PilE